MHIWKEKEGDVRLVIVVECAQRLILELMVQLAELVSSSLLFMMLLTFNRPKLTFALYLAQRPHGR